MGSLTQCSVSTFSILIGDTKTATNWMRCKTRMQKPKNMAAKIPQAFEERIVELSLQHPDFGARRLVPLLKAEKIVVSASKIHATLKRRGLNNRAKRYAKLKERHVSDIQPIRTVICLLRPKRYHQLKRLLVSWQHHSAIRPVLKDIEKEPSGRRGF
jgi:hypothetical protein